MLVEVWYWKTIWKIDQMDSKVVLKEKCLNRNIIKRDLDQVNMIWIVLIETIFVNIHSNLRLEMINYMITFNKTMFQDLVNMKLVLESNVEVYVGNDRIEI